MHAGHQLRRDEARRRPAARPISRDLAVAARDRVRDVDDERLRGERLAVVLADLLDRAIGDDEQDDFAELDRFGDRAGACASGRRSPRGP